MVTYTCSDSVLSRSLSRVVGRDREGLGGAVNSEEEHSFTAHGRASNDGAILFTIKETSALVLLELNAVGLVGTTSGRAS